MKKYISFLFTIVITQLYSQQIKGVVSYYEGNGKPASGIEISAFGCNTTYSLENGLFILECPKKSIGQPVRLIIGPKNNEGEQIELVNEAQLQFLAIPENPDTSPIDLIVCYPGEKEKSAIRYYNLIADDYLGELSNNIQKITKSLDDSNLGKSERKELTEELSRIRIERDQAQQQAENLSEFIASLNLPKASLLVQNAVQAIESGQGIEKALAIISEEALKKEEIDSKIRFIQSTMEILNGYFLRINLLLPKFKYKEVIKSYENIIRIFETNNFKGDGLADLYTSVAHIYFLNGQYDIYLNRLEKGLSLWLEEKTFNNPRRANVMMNLGVYNEALGNTEKGLDFQLKAKEIIENSPDDPGKIIPLGLTYSKIGNSYIKLNDFEKGLYYLKKGVQTIEKSTLQFDKNRVLGIAYDDLAKGYKAILEYDKALDAQLSSIKLLEKVHIRPNPELATIYFNMANLLIELGRIDEAEIYSKKGLDIRLSTQNPEHPQIIQSYLTEANILTQKEHYNESLLLTKKVISLLENENDIITENLINAYQIQSWNLIKLNKQDEGIRIFEKSIDMRKRASLGNTFIQLHDNINLCSLLSEANRLEESEKCSINILKTIEKDFPENKADLGQIYWNLAQLYKSKKDLKLAYNYYEKCNSVFKEIYPNNGPKQEMIDNLFIELELRTGAELYKKERYSNSLEHFLLVVSKKPSCKIVSEGQTMPVYQFIGSCYYQLEDYENAISGFQQALEIYPEYSEAEYYNDIGLSYFKNNNLNEAKNAFDNYLNKNPENWRANRNLAMYFAEIKNYDNALKYLEHSIELGFDDKKWLNENSSFKALKKNSRFLKLLKQLK